MKYISKATRARNTEGFEVAYRGGQGTFALVCSLYSGHFINEDFTVRKPANGYNTMINKECVSYESR